MATWILIKCRYGLLAAHKSYNCKGAAEINMRMNLSRYTYTLAVMNEDRQGKGSPGKPPFGVHESANMAFNGPPIRRHRADEKHSQV